jgi:hypothetical protein
MQSEHSVWFGVAALLACTVVACSGSSTSTGAGVGPDASVPPGEETAGRCFGEPIPARDYHDIASCYAQGGTWTVHGVNGGSYCTGGSPKCEYRGYEGDEAQRRRSCTALIGCSWRNTDGSVVKHPYLGGTCEGTAVKCEDIEDVAVCRSQPGCQTDTLSDDCERRVSFESSPYDCPEMSGSGTSYHPDIAQDACTKRLGCTWKDPPRP